MAAARPAEDEIDRHSAAPMYDQLRHLILDGIERDGLQPGDPLPGEHRLCERYGISRTVVRQALAQLEHEGMVERVKGKGTFVSRPRTSEALVHTLIGLFDDVERRGGHVHSDILRHERADADADVAAALEVPVGSPVIAGPAYASVGRTWRLADRAGAYRELREHLAPVAEYAAERGVTVAVEPLNRYETSLINTVDQALEALDGLAGCALALDVYHMNIEETDLPAAVGRAAGRIAHVQVSANDRGAPGRDHLDWRAIMEALDRSGYTGPVVIESFTAHNATIATAASVWRPLAPTQDAIAVDGLRHLRSLTHHA